MAVDTFTIEDFDNALPKLKSGGKAFTYTGFLDGEHCWHFQLKDKDLRILIRSSIDNSGVSASVGADSIRIIIQCLSVKNETLFWRAIGKASDAYTTRVPGWQKRLNEKIKEVFRKADRVKKPFFPEKNEAVSFSKNEAHKGRPFAHIEGQFQRWLDK